MISISTINANIEGNVVLNQSISSKMGARPARMTRIATLDGGAVVVHSGVNDSDRTFIVNAMVSETKETNLLTIYESETAFLFSCKAGLFYGAIDGMQAENGNVKFNFLVETKEN